MNHDIREPSREEDRLASVVVDACVKLHMALGPGLLESVYERILAHELTLRDCCVARQVSIPITYGGLTFEEGFRADLIVDDRLIVELKSVEKVLPVHKKQLLTCQVSPDHISPEQRARVVFPAMRGGLESG